MKVLVYVTLFLMIAVWAYWIGKFLRFRDTNRRVQELLDSDNKEKKQKTKTKLDTWG